ncbi:Malate dehydrogenase 2 [Durusdinium trenchii]|uniref:Mitochondrial n=1 Tax=Durusdinium trenchii TaxID=1381693 RepID=A0ABP0INM1_9DINO
MREHPKCRHIFADVQVFKDLSGWCYHCNMAHNISSEEFKLDLFICGPSCKDLSRLNNSRIHAVGCYGKDENDQVGTSGPTYHFGFKRDWTRLDSQHFLTPQRRNRIWGIATLVTGHQGASEAVSADFADCLKSMQSHSLFPRDDVFMDLPAAPVKQGRHEEILEKVKMMNPGKTDMYVDLSTSIDGGRLMAGDGVCPCISTNHPVFSTRMDRYLTTGDFLNLQGFFQSAISESTRCELLANPGFALDLLGNSFTSTVCQAVLLSAFAVTPATWETVINRLKSYMYERHQYMKGLDREGMRAYDEAVDKKIHNPAEYVKSLNLKGFFRCCIYKWKKSRVQQQWTLICQAAPKLAKRFKEVPNCLRKMIGLGVKFNIRTKQDGASSTLPVGFENVIADYAAERISLGEEVTNRFIKNTLAIGIDQWNHAVSMVHEKDPKELLALLESATDEKELEDQVESLQRKLNVQLPGDCLSESQRAQANQDRQSSLLGLSS